MDTASRVLVTGADGMLGSSICLELLKQGYQVKGISLPEKAPDWLTGLSVEIVTGNILDKDFLLSAMSDCDYVIHTAALTTVWPRRSKLIVDTNLNGTRNIAEVAERTKIKRMVHIGTACSFNHGNIEKPGDETNIFTGWKFGMDYIDSKYLAQKMLLDKYLESGFPVIIVNPTYMIGPFDSGPSSGKMVKELLDGRLPGYSPGGKNFVCSKDVAIATVNALRSGRLGQCYIVGNENLSYKEFFRKVCATGNRKFRLIGVPAVFILLFGLFNSILARLVSKPPNLSFTMARFSCIKQFYSSKKAIEELNISPTPIENGIDDCIKWFELNGYLR